MPWLINTVLALLGVLFLAGCATRPSGPFRNSEGYETLAPVSVEVMEYFMAVQHDTVASIIRGVEERLENAEDLRGFLRDTREINERTRLAADPDWIEFTRRLRPDDQLFLFEYRERYYQDFGIMVVRDNEIVFRTVWESAAPEGVARELLQNPEIDRL